MHKLILLGLLVIGICGCYQKNSEKPLKYDNTPWTYFNKTKDGTRDVYTTSNGGIAVIENKPEKVQEIK